MMHAEKFLIVDALIDLKIALNEHNRLIDKNNNDTLNNTDLIEYDKCKKGFEAVELITKCLKR